MRPDKQSVLLLVDIQNDFLPTGALPVAHGDEVVPIANSVQEQFDHVLAVRDWHPADHGSFASTHGKKIGETIDLDGLPQLLWPDHCVQDTRGAQFAPGLKVDKVRHHFLKGVDRRIDSYGAFYDNGWRRATGLEHYLKQHHITHVYVLGLATDYCVKFTVLDGLILGFKMTVVSDGCRAVNLSPDDGAKALEEMRQAGAEIIQSSELEAKQAQA